MKPLLVVFVLFKLVHGDDNVETKNGTNLCENSGCFCQSNEEQVDFPYVDIDCSFNEEEFFIGNDVLPDHVNLLDLSANNFTELDLVSNLLRSTTMKRLFLNRNELATLSGNCLDLPALTYLDLSENKLRDIDPAVFNKLKDLQYLNLASNMFTTFSPGNFKNLNVLEVLILDDNSVGKHLTGVSLFQENGLYLNPKIVALSLENIGLRDLPDNFLAEAFDLRSLRLARNSLTIVPELPYTIEYLDLSDNAITEIDSDDFSNMPALKELILNNLEIEEIPEYTFASMKALKKLELKGNRKMKHFDVLAFGQDVLEDSDDFVMEVLTLRGSLLSTLDEALLEPFSRLSQLDLQGNPWQCDCNLIWIKKLQIPPEDSDHIRCFRPISLFNSQIFEVEDDKFVCVSLLAKYQRVGSYIVVGLALFLVGLSLWVFIVVPKYQGRKHILQRMVSPTSPYSRITIEPNAAEDYR